MGLTSSTIVTELITVQYLASEALKGGSTKPEMMHALISQLQLMQRA